MLITENLLYKIKSEGLTLEEYYVLFSKALNTGFTNILRPALSTYENLRKLGLLTQSNNLTSEGTQVLNCISGMKSSISESEEEKFREWWNTFPTSDKADGRVPPYSQKRMGETQCRNLYVKYLRDGVKHEDVIRGLKKEVEARTNKSELKYMKSSLRWLKEETWKLYGGETENSEGTTDISIF